MNRLLRRTLTAPGKLFIAGEYAVLWGGTCRVMAVAPHTHAAVVRREDREVHLLLEEGRRSGVASTHGVVWKQPITAPFAFVARTVDLALRAASQESLGFSLALSPSPRAPDGQKLGLGSSARAVVLAAEATRYVLDARFDALRLALLAHASAQGGKGSGGDVVASGAGGLLRYRRYDVSGLAQAAQTSRLGAALLEAQPIDLVRLPPPKVELVWAYGGEAASTTGLIGRAEARLSDADRADFVRRSDALGEALEEGLFRPASFEHLREACRDTRALLSGLGPLETPAMQQILALAESHGCTGKQSGAGGGDGCILFAPDAERRAALVEALTLRGFRATLVTPAQGLSGSSMEDPQLNAWLSAD